jgi:predicted nucleic acid-binding protein
MPQPLFPSVAALELGWPVVTSNRDDFSRIEGLVIESWR